MPQLLEYTFKWTLDCVSLQDPGPFPKVPSPFASLLWYLWLVCPPESFVSSGYLNLLYPLPLQTHQSLSTSLLPSVHLNLISLVQPTSCLLSPSLHKVFLFVASCLLVLQLYEKPPATRLVDLGAMSDTNMQTEVWYSI